MKTLHYHIIVAVICSAAFILNLFMLKDPDYEAMPFQILFSGCAGLSFVGAFYHFWAIHLIGKESE